MYYRRKCRKLKYTSNRVFYNWSAILQEVISTENLSYNIDPISNHWELQMLLYVQTTNACICEI
jgi:hypothetical protein